MSILDAGTRKCLGFATNHEPALAACTATSARFRFLPNGAMETNEPPGWAVFSKEPPWNAFRIKMMVPTASANWTLVRKSTQTVSVEVMNQTSTNLDRMCIRETVMRGCGLHDDNWLMEPYCPVNFPHIGKKRTCHAICNYWLSGNKPTFRYICNSPSSFHANIWIMLIHMHIIIMHTISNSTHLVQHLEPAHMLLDTRS